MAWLGNTSRDHLCWLDRSIKLWPFSRIKCDFKNSLLGKLKENTPVQHCGWDWNISAASGWVAIDSGFWLLCHGIWRMHWDCGTPVVVEDLTVTGERCFISVDFPLCIWLYEQLFMEDYEQLLLLLHLQRILGNCDWLSAHKAWEKMVMLPV